MGYRKGTAVTAVLLVTWVCAGAQAAPAGYRQGPDSVYDVSTDYGWTMSSRESSGYYTFSSPLRLKMRISFTKLDKRRLQMRLHFYEVSYIDESHSWTIEDFSDPEKIRGQFYQHCGKAANLKHLTELAAFEEEALGYLMALSHGSTFTIHLSQDTAATLANLRGQLMTAIQPASLGPGAETEGAAQVKYERAARMGVGNTAIAGILRGNSHLGMTWAHQMLQLAMFAQRPAYRTLAPDNASMHLYRTLAGGAGSGSGAGRQTRVPAFSLCGLYRWLPTHQNLFARLDGVRSEGGQVGKRYNVSGLGAVQNCGAWLLGPAGTYHSVRETLDKTSSGRVEYRRVKIESRLDWVDVLAFLPNGMGIRGKIKVDAKTTLEATFNAKALIMARKAVKAAHLEERIAAAAKRKDYSRAMAMCRAYLRTYPDLPRSGEVKQRLGELQTAKAAELEERIAAAANRKDYSRATVMCRAYLRTYPDLPRSGEVKQRLEELQTAEAEPAPKRIETWTNLAELGLRNGRPDVARKYLTKIISEYPETAGAAEAQDRLTALPGISTES